jgi:hypothetical protein
MARIWPVLQRDGREEAPPFPWVEVPLAEAVRLCELRPGDLGAALTMARPGFVDPELHLWYTSFKRVAVEVEEAEAPKAKWKPGFYWTRLTPQEVFRRLIEQPMIEALGTENVVRVEVDTAIDALGRGATRPIVVITPDALDRLDVYTIVAAEARLRERLREMHVAGVAIIGYGTEAELAELEKEDVDS